jgi:hypothetical protein
MHEGENLLATDGVKSAIHVANRCPNELHRGSTLRHFFPSRSFSAASSSMASARSFLSIIDEKTGKMTKLSHTVVLQTIGQREGLGGECLYDDQLGDEAG